MTENFFAVLIPIFFVLVFLFAVVLGVYMLIVMIRDGLQSAKPSVLHKPETANPRNLRVEIVFFSFIGILQLLILGRKFWQGPVSHQEVVSSIPPIAYFLFMAWLTSRALNKAKKSSNPVKKKKKHIEE